MFLFQLGGRPQQGVGELRLGDGQSCLVLVPAEETYKWLVELPVAALSLDFLGVPGQRSGSPAWR